MGFFSYCKVFHFINEGEHRKTFNGTNIVFIVSCNFDIVRFKMSFLRESLKKHLPGTKKADSRKDNSCKDKNEGMLHILAPGFFYKQF